MVTDCGTRQSFFWIGTEKGEGVRPGKSEPDICKNHRLSVLLGSVTHTFRMTYQNGDPKSVIIQLKNSPIGVTKFQSEVLAVPTIPTTFFSFYHYI